MFVLMKFRSILVLTILSLAGAAASRAQIAPPPVKSSDLYSMSQHAEARRLALTQQKPIGFLLTWPNYFPGGGGDFIRRGSAFTTRFYLGFKDDCVLINVDLGADEYKHLPMIVQEAFHEVMKGRYAPALCLMNPTLTKSIAVLGLWKSEDERAQSFAHCHTLIADKNQWWEEPKAKSVATARGAAGVPVAPAVPVITVPDPVVGSPAISSGFAREMELTRQAEQQQQQSKGASSPKP